MTERITLLCSGCGEKFERPDYNVVEAENYYCSQDCRKKKGENECPWDGCEYTSDSELGIKQHHKRTHGVSLTEVELTCDQCNETFTRQRSRDKRFDGTFCSRECKDKHMSETLKTARTGSGNPNWEGKNSTDKVTVTCDSCGDVFDCTRYQKQRTERNFCSRKCYNEALSEDFAGESNPRWRGGYEPYYGPEWHSQRRKALQRDEYECQDCGLTREQHYDEYDADLEVHHIQPIRTFEDTSEANQLSNLVTLCTECHTEHEHSDEIKLTV